VVPATATGRVNPSSTRSPLAQVAVPLAIRRQPLLKQSSANRIDLLLHPMVHRSARTMSTTSNDSQPETAWGALLAGFASASLFTVGSAYISSIAFLLAGVGLTSVTAGFSAPQRTHFAAVVLTITGPFPFGHLPAPLGGIALHLVYSCLDTDHRRTCLPDSAFAVHAVTLGFACTYPIYWMLVQLGRQLRLRLRMRRLTGGNGGGRI
jgi:hypothetical protein